MSPKTQRTLYALARLPAVRVLLLSVPLILSASCSFEAPVSETRGFILISIDTLRADHLGTYGYTRDTSPFIDSLAGKSVLFENAFVQLPGTLPSHMSIFTGLYPAEHGVYPPDGVLPERIRTLPEVLQSAGFRTAGFTEGGYVNGNYGFRRGFEEFNDKSLQNPNDIERTFARGVNFLKKVRANEKYFLFLHTYAVHDPYFPPEPFASEFDALPVPGAFEPTGPNFEKFNANELTISPEALRYYRSAYDASIRYMDTILESFFDDLSDLGLMENVTIILTSDHGEEFLEHGKAVHEQIYRETLQVPLLIYHPKLKPRRIPAIVESIDIAPTVYELARIKPDFRVSGKSLVPYLMGSGADTEGEAYAEDSDTASRTLVRQVKDGVYQYLELEPRYQNRGIWVNRSVTFDSLGDDLHFDVGAFYEDRQLDVLVDGELLESFPIQPNTLRHVQLKLPGKKARKRVTLATEGCISPKEIGQSDDRRCLSFRIENLAVKRAELYEISSDPDGTHEISEQDPNVLRLMHQNLEKYPHGSGEPMETRPLDPEEVRRLKALGYLK